MPEKVVEEPPKEEAKVQVVVNAAGQQIKKIKGPKPRGLTKFKPMASEEQVIEETELSENQKKKIETKRLKREAEEKAYKEEQEKQRLLKIKL